MKIHTSITRLLLAGIFLSSAACEDMADLRVDPNSPGRVPENLALTSVLGYFSYQVVGNQPARIPNLWVQQLAFNGVPPTEDNYNFDEADANNLWEYYSWTDVMNNANDLALKAEAHGNHAYAGIARIILAWNLGVLTDLYGDVPWSEAFDPANFRPAFDTQEEVYKAVIALLDQGIADLDKPGLRQPSGDDLLYGGDLVRWKKLAHTVKARFLIHLTRAPGYDAQAQARKALDALRYGFTSNSDDADFAYYNKTGAQNPWYQFAIDGKWDTRDQLSKTYIDLLKSRRDPRLPIQARQAGAVDNSGVVAGFTPVPFDPAVHFRLSDSTYFGHRNGETGVASTEISSIGSYYSAPDAPLTWISHAEARFIEAEAILLVEGPAAAQPVFEAAVTASMNKLGVPASDRAAYLAGRPKLTDPGVNALREIMLEKWVANFLSLENYNDWRRNGYPELSRVTNQPYADLIPLRWPYPTSELTRNAANVDATGVPRGFAAFRVPVWWDTTP